jgi:hypothetical protein
MADPGDDRHPHLVYLIDVRFIADLPLRWQHFEKVAISATVERAPDR